MSSPSREHVSSKYKYELLFGAWMLVTGGIFLRIRKQPYSASLKTEQYESIFKGTSLGAVLLGLDTNITPSLASPQPFTCQSHLNSQTSTKTAYRYDTNITLPMMLIKHDFANIELNLWNPLYALAPFVLLAISLPLAIFAVATTTLAISLLFFRAAVVYVQLAAAVTGAWFDALTSHTSPAIARSAPKLSTEPRSTSRHTKLRSSNASAASSQETIVPHTNTTRSVTFGTSEMTRDFEGVGGWRAPGDEDEEALWMGLNSRLQLPAEIGTRRHQRSLTGGTISPAQRWNWSPGTLRRSPVQSRSRTPVRFADDGGEYFPSQPMTSLRPLGTAADPARHHRRRKSGSGDSGSSGASGVMMAPRGVGK
ncbi:hypothetical protein GQ44DRAFT_750779 [Phaeosphaeriaceae sp. PMI808]|nr:hypothetical protein GQ44DRAFT_750779 [Phaeosphaeriaceae sp. PMI808]